MYQINGSWTNKYLNLISNYYETNQPTLSILPLNPLGGYIEMQITTPISDFK